MYPQPARIYGDIIPGSEFIRSLVRQGTISKDASKRLRWFDYYASCGNARKTYRHFGISALPLEGMGRRCSSTILRARRPRIEEELRDAAVYAGRDAFKR